MLKDIFLISFFIWCGGFSLLAQSPVLLPLDNASVDSVSVLRFQKIRNLETSAVQFATDKLGQLYLIDELNEVTKFGQEGNFLFDYNNNTLGDLSYLDTSNPFNLLLFYGDYLTIITLDRTLNQTGSYVLTDLGMSDITGVGISTENNIWVFDNLTYELKKIDSDGNLVLKSNVLSDLFVDDSFPIQIIENNRVVHLVVPEVGVMLFDDFGQYMYTVEVKDLSSLQVGEHEFTYFSDQQLYSFNYLSRQTTPIKLPDEVSEEAKLSLQKNHLYILEKGTLRVYYAARK